MKERDRERTGFSLFSFVVGVELEGPSADTDSGVSIVAVFIFFGVETDVARSYCNSTGFPALTHLSYRAKSLTSYRLSGYFVRSAGNIPVEVKPKIIFSDFNPACQTSHNFSTNVALSKRAFGPTSFKRSFRHFLPDSFQWSEARNI